MHADRFQAAAVGLPTSHPGGGARMPWVVERARPAVPTEIIPLPADRRHLAADFLARACADHPLLPYLVPVRALRTRQALAEAALTLIDFGEHCGEVDVTAGRLDGLAIWLTPGTSWTAPARRARTVRLAAALGLGPDGFMRCLRLAFHLERIGHRLLPVPHRELLLVAVHPDRRDRGIEEALLRVGLARADAACLPVATVCYRAAPVLFYLKHGFQAFAEGDLPGGGPRYWLLSRPAGG
jgi:ribosomal protein S18 acetylase RimI-like enzyme